MKRLNYVAIIQVRTGSKRFPKKSLKKLGQYRIIDWVIKRTKKTLFLDSVILATTNKKNDKIFEKIAKKNNVKIFFGDQNNVLKRYCDAANKFKVKNIVRICADNPFISPEFIRKLIVYHKKNRCDLAFNHVSKKKFKFNCIDGLGAEIFSTKTLNKILTKTKNKKNLEHVTKYFYENSEKFKIKNFKYIKDFSKLNLSVDNRKDIKLARKIAKKFDNHRSKKDLLGKIINYSIKI